MQNKYFQVPTKPEDYQWAGISDAEITRFDVIKCTGRLKNPVSSDKNPSFSNCSWHAPPTSAQAGSGATFDFVLVSESLLDANCVKAAEILSQTRYEGRACLEQLGFYGSDHSLVVLELEPHWTARYEANQKCLQAIQAAELRTDSNAEALFDDDCHVPATDTFIYKEAEERVLLWVHKARKRKIFWHQC